MTPHPATATFKMLEFVVVCWGTVEALESIGALLRLHDRWTDSLFPSGNYVSWYYLANHSDSIMAFARYVTQISDCATGHFLISSQRCTWSLFSKGYWSCSGQFMYLFIYLLGLVALGDVLCVLLSGENLLSSWKSTAPTAAQVRRGTLRISMVCTTASPPLVTLHTCPFRHVYMHNTAVAYRPVHCFTSLLCPQFRINRHKVTNQFVSVATVAQTWFSQCESTCVCV